MSSSAKARSSSDGAGRTEYASAAPSTSALPPVTPRRKHKRRSVAPLSSKQYEKLTRQIMQVQQSSRRQGFPIDEEQEGEASSFVAPLPSDALARLNLNGPADSDAVAALGSQADVDGTVNVPTSTRLRSEVYEGSERVESHQATDHWLRRLRTGAPQASHAGKGPGNPLALATRSYRSTKEAPNDSFAHEGSFLLNPLGRRIPQQPIRSTTETKPAPIARYPPEDGDLPEEPVQGASSPADEAPQRRHSPLRGAPREIQEAALMEDLVFVLMGIEGQYIHVAPGHQPDELASQLRGATYTVDETLDTSLRELALRILPLASCFSAISAFVDVDSGMQYGTVMHALCAAIRQLLREHADLLVNLEHQLATSTQFTLQKLWLEIHPQLHRLSLLYAFVTDIAAITHANVLDSDSEAGDSDADDSDTSGDDEDEGMRDARQEMEAERRRLFKVDTHDEETDVDSVEGGIVKGGEILSMLWDRIERQSGDPRAHELFLNLFKQASRPYASILTTWISTGILNDPYDEFMVFEDHRVTYDSLKTDPSDIYWEQRYTLRDAGVLAARERERQGLSDEEYQRREQEDEHLIATGRGLFTGGAKIPSFLEGWKGKILLAGKYLNVVRECGVTIDPSHAASSLLTNGDDDKTSNVAMTDDAFLQQIERAYQYANARLLSLLMNDYHLVDRLRSLRHYFLFSSSDFFSSFVEQAERELRRLVNPLHVRDSVKTRLQTHLGMVLGSSAVVGFSDPYKDDVKVSTALDNPYESLKRIANTRGVKGGADAAEAIALKAKLKARERDYTAILLDVLEFDVTVKFPVSLVISRKNMIRWKFLHTVLIQLKVTERQLADVWLEQQGRHWQARAKDHPELEGWKMRVFKLRHRMTFFVQNLLAFFTSEIIEPNWALLEKKMQTVTTVDAFLRDHTEFLNECRKECMLTDVRFVEFLQRLMTCARTFYDNRSRLDDHVLMTSASWSAAKLAGEAVPAELGPDMWRSLEKQESKWARSLKGFNSTVQLLATTDNPSALPLAMRLQSA